MKLKVAMLGLIGLWTAALVAGLLSPRPDRPWTTFLMVYVVVLVALLFVWAMLDHGRRL